jgi:adenylate cyclase, class 2
MAILNVEFKAKTSDILAAENILLKQKPIFIGEDHQVDTYYNVPNGRMKLREGNIENALIYYERENMAGSKSSHVVLYKHLPDKALKNVLTNALGIKVVVDKRRKIYFIDNVKFHFDNVQGLGNFIEVEAIDKDGSIGKEKLQAQCEFYAGILKISNNDFLANSYSDMIMGIKKP